VVTSGASAAGWPRTLALLLALLLTGLAAASCGSQHDSGHRLSKAEQRELRARVFAAGDSITYGYATSAPPQTAYPALAGVQSIGFNGACVSVRCPPPFDAQDWFEDRVRALPGHPDICVALYGINDVAIRYATVEETIQGYEKLAAKAKKLGVRMFFGTLTPLSPTAEATFHTDAKRRELNDWIRKQPGHLDYETAVIGDDGWLKPAYDSGDGLHLNDAGDVQLAKVLDDWIATGAGSDG
jgi:lysophospholipase L1-like esterase